MTDVAFMMQTCAALPGAEVSQPFGEGAEVWKVGGKIFAIVAASGVSVKTGHAETAALLVDAGGAERAPYLHASWVRLPPGRMAEEELASRIGASYALIRGSLSRKAQAALG